MQVRRHFQNTKRPLLFGDICYPSFIVSSIRKFLSFCCSFDFIKWCFLSYIKLSKKSTKLGFLIAPLPPLLLSSHPFKKTSQTTETFIEGYKRNRAYLKNHFLFSHDFWLRKSLRAERAREHLVHVCLKQFTDQELRWNLEPPTIQREKERREVGQLTLCPQISM